TGAPAVRSTGSPSGTPMLPGSPGAPGKWNETRWFQPCGLLSGSSVAMSVVTNSPPSRSTVTGFGRIVTGVGSAVALSSRFGVGANVTLPVIEVPLESMNRPRTVPWPTFAGRVMSASVGECVEGVVGEVGIVLGGDDADDAAAHGEDQSERGEATERGPDNERGHGTYRSSETFAADCTPR